MSTRDDDEWWEYWALEMDERNKKDLQDWVNNDQLEALVEEESGGIIGYMNRYNIGKIVTILNLWWNEHKPKVGEKIYVGNAGECTVVDDIKNGIEVYFVYEEDGTLSWQLIPDESDIVLKSVIVSSPVNYTCRSD